MDNLHAFVGYPWQDTMPRGETGYPAPSLGIGTASRRMDEFLYYKMDSYDGDSGAGLIRSETGGWSGGLGARRASSTYRVSCFGELTAGRGGPVPQVLAGCRACRRRAARLWPSLVRGGAWCTRESLESRP